MSQRGTVLALRWVVIIATSYLLIAENGFDIGIGSITFIAAFILSNLLLGLLGEAYFTSASVYRIVAVADILLVTGSVYAFAGPASDFYVVYFFIIMLSALGESVKTTLIAAGISSLLYAAYSLKTFGMGYELPIRVMFLFVIAIFNSFLVSELKVERLARRLLEGDVSTLQNTVGKEKEKFGETLLSLDAISARIKNMGVELKIKNDYLAFLCRLAESAGYVRAGGEIFSEIADWANENLGFEVAAVRLLNGDDLVLLYSKGIEDSLLPDIHKVRYGETISGIAALTKKPAIARDIDLSGAAYILTAKGLGLKSLASIPIFSQGKVIGTFSAGSRFKRDMDQGRINMMSIMACMLALTLCHQETESVLN